MRTGRCNIRNGPTMRTQRLCPHVAGDPRADHGQCLPRSLRPCGLSVCLSVTLSRFLVFSLSPCVSPPSLSLSLAVPCSICTRCSICSCSIGTHSPDHSCSYIHVCACVCMCVHVCACVCMCVSVCLCVWVSMCVCWSL